MKYRFNWNAPIIWSKHEPNTYYHAAQLLLRTRDLGQTWEEVSPDLSRNEKDKQGKGGGPYTNEAVGAENYGTISYVAESPHEKGVMWVGTDDGLVQLTKDGGQNWQNVTPAGLEECLVNAIDISPHDPATVYIATTRYKFNDHMPGLYKTTNYGKSWTNISSGIPKNVFTRVLREDDKRKDLLFAGCETGLYVSWNGGKDWRPFNLNLPVTPITDLIIRHDDLIVATSGRSFWILDDLGLVRQLDSADKDFLVFKPENAIIANGSSELNKNSKKFKGSKPLHGVNPANGVVIYYQLPKLDKKKHISLEIRNETSQLIRQFSSKKDSTFKKWDGGPAAEPTIGKQKGLNRFVWDMRHASTQGVPGVYIEGSYKGHKVSPGKYTATIIMGDKKTTADFEVLANPLYPLKMEDYKVYDDFMMSMEIAYTDMHKKLNKIYKLKNQLKAIIKELPTDKKYDEARKGGKLLLAKMKKWDEEMVQRKSKAYDDVENFPNKFTAEYFFLINQSESDIPIINKPSRDRRKELDEQWSSLSSRAKEIIEVDIPTINKKLWASGIGPVWTKD